MGKLIALFQKAQKNLFKQAYVIMPQHRQKCDAIERKAQSERRKLRNQSAEIASHNSPFDTITSTHNDRLFFPGIAVRIKTYS